ncbi:hypothetical protein ACFL56_03105 [Candidatus Margulisiibacteriota bacterium]
MKDFNYLKIFKIVLVVGSIGLVVLISLYFYNTRYEKPSSFASEPVKITYVSTKDIKYVYTDKILIYPEDGSEILPDTLEEDERYGYQVNYRPDSIDIEELIRKKQFAPDYKQVVQKQSVPQQGLLGTYNKVDDSLSHIQIIAFTEDRCFLYWRDYGKSSTGLLEESFLKRHSEIERFGYKKRGNKIYITHLETVYFVGERLHRKGETKYTLIKNSNGSLWVQDGNGSFQGRFEKREICKD